MQYDVNPENKRGCRIAEGAMSTLTDVLNLYSISPTSPSSRQNTNDDNNIIHTVWSLSKETTAMPPSKRKYPSESEAPTADVAKSGLVDGFAK